MTGAILRVLERRDLRRYLGAQLISLIGSRVQDTAQAWLVWRLTGRPLMLGQLSLLMMIPSLLLGPASGWIADRWPRRTIFLVSQSLAALQALTLGLLTITGHIRPSYVLALGLVSGLLLALEQPARHALVADLAGDDVRNAVSLNSAMFHSAAMIGPLLAGILIRSYGEGICFLLNTGSYAVILGALAVLPATPPHADGRARGALAEGVRFAWATPPVRATLLSICCWSLSSGAALQFLPALTTEVLRADSRALGLLQGALGVGSLTGALVNLGPGRAITFGRACLGLALNAVGLFALAASRDVALSTVAAFVAGLGVTSFLTPSLALLQVGSPASMRGRVLGLYSMAFAGLVALGALAQGWVEPRLGMSRLLGSCATVTLLVSLALWIGARRMKHESRG
jgi:predicted MFS family arabinose efflux permease